jgi:hypothetical protein
MCRAVSELVVIRIQKTAQTKFSVRRDEVAQVACVDID